MKKTFIFIALLSTGATAEPKDPTQRDGLDSVADAIGEVLLKPLHQNFTDRIMRDLAKDGGSMSKSAHKHLENRKIEEQIAYDEEMKQKHQAVMKAKRCKTDCKPRPIQECMKPDYTIDDDVIGCSKGEITKHW